MKKKKKTRKVVGVDLASGFWWLIEESEEYKILKNKANQRMLLRVQELNRIKFKEKRIKEEA